MQNVVNAVLNTIFVSIPEEIVWVVFTLMLLKRMDLLDIYRWKHNIKEIMIPVIPIAILINVFRYILHISNLANFLIIEVLMCGLIMYVIKRNNFLNEKINYVKIIMSVIVSDFIIIFMTECFYAVIIFSMLNKSIVDINNNIWLNIVLSILPRLLQIAIVLTYLYKKNIQTKINYFETIFKDKILSISLLIFLLMTNLVYFLIFTYVVNTKMLQNCSLIIQIISSMSFLIIPIVFVILYMIPIIYLLYRNVKDKEQTDNMLMDKF